MNQLDNAQVAGAHLWRRYQVALILVACVGILILLGWGSSLYEQHSKEQFFEQRNAEVKLVRQRKAEMFAQRRTEILASVRAMMQKHDWDGASLEASKWRELSDPELAALEATVDAEKHKIFQAEQEKRNKIALAERREQEKAEREAKRAELAYRRKHGVSVGMTKEEVLQSNWGRPESVNRTVYSSGVHEQWVYPGYNYLYFEDDKLTAVQNH